MVDRIRKLIQQGVRQDSFTNIIQATGAQQSYKAAQQALDLMKQKVCGLIIHSPVSDELNPFEAQIGQGIAQGEQTGQMDEPNDFKVSVNVDEHYIFHIYPGQSGTFSFADPTYTVKIKKVYTQVADGSFQACLPAGGEKLKM